MKILYLKAGITVELSGGGAETSKMLYAIEQWVQNHPNNSLTVISGDRMDIQGRTAPVKKHWKDIASRALFHSSYLYIDWRFGGLKDLMIGADPDVVFLANSRLGFAIKEIRMMKPDCFVIVHFDNVEFDYVDSAFSLKRSILGRVFKNIEKIAVRRDETIGSQSADINLVLTERDKNRLEELYGFGEGKSFVLPVCLPDKLAKLHKVSEHSPQLVFLGSLWYESNATALVWFLDNIWPAVKTSFPNALMTVGGRNPSKYLTDYLAKEQGVILFPDFENIADVVCRNSIFISPIQKGAGMKVKVAEALSLGLPILASEESLIGYSEALLDPMNQGVITKVETIEEYLVGLNSVIASEFGEISDHARRLFEKYYSYSRAITSIDNILENICCNKRDRYGNCFAQNIYPLVSIIMPVFNSEVYLNEAVDSIINQTYKNWQLIIVDDASADGSCILARKLAHTDERIIVIENQINLGVSESRNKGIETAKGEWIAFLDSDDIWTLDKLQHQLKLAEDKKADFVYTNIYLKEDGYQKVESGSILPRISGYKSIRKGNYIACSSVMIRKNIMQQFRFEKSELYEDYILWLKILKSGTLAYCVDKPLVTIRMRKNSRSADKTQSVLKVYRGFRYVGMGRAQACCYTVTNAFRAIMKYSNYKIRRKKSKY